MGLIEIIVQKFVFVDREMAYFCEFLYAKKDPLAADTSSKTRSAKISYNKKTPHRVESDEE